MTDRTEIDWDAVLGAPGFALGIATSGDRLSRIEFLHEQPARRARNALAADTVRQLAAYLADPHHRFDLACLPEGTAHQQMVWQVMLDIAPGHTLTYGDVARRIGSSPRAVGGACGANPLPVVIPCHRIVASGGALGGFAHSTQGFLPGIKRWLLAHEAAGGDFMLTASGPVLS
jgi:methylated-DNA-[protein]-cysteine S-methyltransferase